MHPLPGPPTRWRVRSTALAAIAGVAVVLVVVAMLALWRGDVSVSQRASPAASGAAASSPERPRRAIDRGVRDGPVELR